jgi:hypothetical protein
MVKRCSRKLEDYEEKLHLVEKFLSVKSDVEQIHTLAAEFKTTRDERIIEQIEVLSNDIINII